MHTAKNICTPSERISGKATVISLGVSIRWFPRLLFHLQSDHECLFLSNICHFQCNRKGPNFSMLGNLSVLQGRRFSRRPPPRSLLCMCCFLQHNVEHSCGDHGSGANKCFDSSADPRKGCARSLTFKQSETWWYIYEDLRVVSDTLGLWLRP